MRLEELVIDFIKRYYVVEYGNRPTPYIVLRDTFEYEGVEGVHIDILTKNNGSVFFLWRNGYHVTGIDLYHKNNEALPALIKKIFKQEKTLDFFKFLTNENIKIIIPLHDIKEEFPGLYGPGYDKIISGHFTKTNG